MASHSEKDNSYANKDGNRIHISEARSGRNDYFCIGCAYEMQAIKSKKPNRISYFRHDYKGGEPRPKCTYSDLQERFKVAGEILVRTKTIKVPAVYKYPPHPEDGLPYRLQNAKFVEGFTVQRNVSFYENSDHDLQYSIEENIPGLTLMFKADVVFLDQREYPILLIQFVEKLANVKDSVKANLGFVRLDTVQVRIPRGSPKEIEDSLSTSTGINWLYNIEHANTEYIRVPFSDSTGVPAIDELQRELFEENFFCRSSQIKRLIRSIAKCLASEHYTEIEERLRVEISKVEHDTIRIQEDSTNDLREEFGLEEERIDRRREELSKGKELLNKLYHDLQTRYKRQKDEVGAEEKSFESRVDEECRVKGNRGSTVGSRKREIEESIRKVEGDIKFRTRSVEELNRKREALPKRFEEEEAKLRKEFEGLEAEERRYGVEAPSRIDRKDIGGSSTLSKRIKEILDVRGVIDDITEKELTLRKYIAAKQWLVSRDNKAQA